MVRPRRSLLVPVMAAAALIAACGGPASSGVATAPAGVTTTPTPAIPTDSVTPTDTPASTTPAPTAASTASSTATGTATGETVPIGDPNGVQDVAALLYPPGPNASACGVQRTGGYASCPVTVRLATRLASNPVPRAEPLCRCQNPWSQRQITVTSTATGGVAHVVLIICGSAGTCQQTSYNTLRIDVTVLRTMERGWVADDTTCTAAGPASSIYEPNPPPCAG